MPIPERDAMAGSCEIILVLSCNTIEEGYEDSKADGGDEGELELHLELG